MAQTLKKDLSFALGNIVAGALESARVVKAQDIAQKESDYQALVADGSMTYEAQLAFRKKQLEEETSSSIPDQSFIKSLKTAIGQITKLNRFSKYRAVYQDSLAGFKSGVETAQQHLDILSQQLNMTTDPDLQAEIQNEITDAKTFVKQSNDAILQNEVTRATKDGTIPVLNQAIQDVNTRRSQAKLLGNDEAVSAYDVTLTNLKSQLNTVTIQNTVNSFEISGLTKGLNATEKLSALSAQIGSADESAPVTIGGKTYTSAKGYWDSILGSYLSGTGSGLFSNFFSELSNTYTNKISAAVARDGFSSSITLDSIKNDFKQFRSSQALQPYLNQLTDLESQALGAAFQSTANHILDTASFTQDFKSADDTLIKYGQTYGIDTQQYRLSLAAEINKQALAATGGDVPAASRIVKGTGVRGITAPSKEFPIEPQTDLSGRYGLIGTTVYNKTTNTGVSEDEFKKQTGIQNLDWSKIKLDMTYKVPENLVVPTAQQPGAVVPAAPKLQPTPSTTPTPSPASAPVLEPKILGAEITAPPPTPVAPVVTPKYQGSSIVDFLKSKSQDFSFTNRKKLADQYGIANYVGSSEQNLKLLGILNK